MDQSTENVLNVTLLEPRMKHPTIFARFDALAAGESFTIHNDHDPKPLYYQLLGERGNVFTWEYLEQGPEWWKVRLSKRKMGASEETLGEIATKDLRKAQIFKKYGLDFCCNGKRTVREACAEKGLDAAQVEHELQEADKATASGARPLPYNEWGLDFLADYVVNTHHAYVKKNMPDMKAYAQKVYQVHGSHHPELERINGLVLAMDAELTGHMHKEEFVLFPAIKQLVAAERSAQPQNPFGTIKSPITVMELEHEELGQALSELRELTGGYTLPQDACASYGLLYRMLEEFEGDMHVHIHLENNILFPKALELEKTLSKL